MKKTKKKTEAYSWNDDSLFKEENSKPSKKPKKEKRVLQEATELPDTDYLWGEALDSAFFTALVIRLTTPTRLLPAFKLGLINASGKILREPMTKQERRALSYIDQIALFMKQSMGGRIATIMNMYRRNRMNPKFIQAAARAISLRFGKYYDMRIGIYDRPYPQAITGGHGPHVTTPGKPRG